MCVAKKLVRYMGMLVFFFCLSQDILLIFFSLEKGLRKEVQRQHNHSVQHCVNIFMFLKKVCNMKTCKKIQRGLSHIFFKTLLCLSLSSSLSSSYALPLKGDHTLWSVIRFLVNFPFDSKKKVQRIIQLVPMYLRDKFNKFKR